MKRVLTQTVFFVGLQVMSLLSVEAGPQVSVETTYTAIVRHDCSLGGALADSLNSRYSWRHEYVCDSNFPPQNSGTVEEKVLLLSFDTATTADTVLATMDRLKLRPATLREMLAVSPQFLATAHLNCLVAFGSLWFDSTGRPIAPVEFVHVDSRWLTVSYLRGWWQQGCHFLAVRQ